MEFDYTSLVTNIGRTLVLGGNMRQLLIAVSSEKELECIMNMKHIYEIYIETLNKKFQNNLAYLKSFENAISKCFG